MSNQVQIKRREQVLMSDAEYVAKQGTVCPHCRSTQLEGSGVQIDGGTAWQSVTCKDCGSSWNDTYKLTGYAEIEAA